MEALGRRIVAVEADVRDLDALTRAAAEGVDQLGRIDIVIANAGISSVAPTLEMSEDVWQTMIDINLTGVWKTVRAAAPHVVAGGRGGSIVMISSLAAMEPNPGIPHYTAAKTGLIGLMRVLAKELASQGIRVNTVHPTTMATDMVLNEMTFRAFRPELENPTREDFEQATGSLTALPTPILQPDDVSDAILHLVSHAGRNLTGITHVIDAGQLL